ncbi:hypothetical protein VTP01DRAFT_5387, partial [Rhizomucor pusillus]|uniref:uncharacterized protein n=1 Tax=Rhizomucor pusillus TaxID=4840 RepID=UPI0037431A9C
MEATTELRKLIEKLLAFKCWISVNLYEDLQSKEQLISTMVPLLPPPTFIHSHYLAQAVPEMRRIIAEMPVLASFADFRFLTCGIGLKVSFTNPEDMPLEFPDLAWDALNHANFLLDVGFEVSPLGSSAPSVAVWRASTVFTNGLDLLQ